MPVPIQQEEQEGINLLVRTAYELLEHPDVVITSPDAPLTGHKLHTTWGLTWGYVRQRPERPIPSRALAAKVSFAAQHAADLLARLPTRLQHRWIKLQFNGAAMPSKTADLLQELAARMNKFRR
jgi:hypothetical protein